MAGMQANVNPEELKRFIKELDNYLKTLDEQTSKIKGAFRHVGETWNDSKFTEFEEKFNKMSSNISAFKKEAEEQLPRLKKMAEASSEYLKV